MVNHVVIAIDLGGTNIRAALCDESGSILKRFKQLTQPEQGATAVISRIAETARAVLPEDVQVAGVGIASPGPIDPYTGTVLYAANLYWRDVPLRDALQNALQLPVTVGNDANLAALGEQRYGAGKGVHDLVYITLSTGIGCGVILNDQLVLGHRGLTTEIGHMVMDFNAPPGDSGVGLLSSITPPVLPLRGWRKQKRAPIAIRICWRSSEAMSTGSHQKKWVKRRRLAMCSRSKSCMRLRASLGWAW